MKRAIGHISMVVEVLGECMGGYNIGTDLRAQK